MKKNHFTSILTALSLVCGSASLINLVRRVLDVGIYPVFHDMFSYYRDITTAIVRPLWFIPYVPPPPALYLDLWPLSFLAAAAYVWSFSKGDFPVLLANSTASGRFMWKCFFVSPVGRPIMILAVGLSMMGLFIFLAILVVVCASIFVPRGQDAEFDEQVRIMRRMAVYVAAIIAMSALFFTINAYAPSAPSG